MSTLQEIARGIEPFLRLDTDLTDTQRAYAMAYIAVMLMRNPSGWQYAALCATDKMWRELDSKTVWQTYIDAILNEPRS